MTDEETSKILRIEEATPCPWCGLKPTLELKEWADGTHMILECCVKMYTKLWSLDYTKVKDELVSKWNSRKMQNKLK